MVTTPLSSFQIAETKTFEKIQKKMDKKLYAKIENLEGYYRYRIGSYMLFYLTHHCCS